MPKQKIEIFTSNSPLCDDTVKLVREVAGNHCDIQICNLQHQPGLVHQYGLKSVPSIAIDGILAIVGKPNRSELEAIGLVGLAAQNEDRDSSQTPIYIGMGI